MSVDPMPCPVCGSEGYGVYQNVWLKDAEAPSFNPRVRKICGSCAGAIANLYCFAHSGKPLNWPMKKVDSRTRPKERIAQKLRWEVFRRDGFRCECGSQADLTVDHIRPESRGGRATLDNLRTLCRPCNSSKGAS